ncbi:ATP-dependent zinc protease [Capilliphycus salinus ALCB114379]|uniref:ATP-dependent zinc protease family protein n=1 Tax=Capilliphycus salinus TaxID=2768948 RepID=UPI0039A65CE7
MSKQKQISIIGWREWVALPELGVTAIKAKIDTGARSSAIHAFHVETFWKGEKHWVRFQMHPFQRNTSETITAEAQILDEREVRNSGGHAEKRIAILTTVELEKQRWPIELTLTNRDVMGFRMLLGRAAVRGHFLVNPGRSYLLSQKPKNLDLSEQDDDDELDSD